MDQEESIYVYDILSQPKTPRPKSPIYMSKKEIELKRLHSSKPKTHATMGYADVPLKTAEEFLKKGEGIHVYSTKQKKRCLVKDKLPQLPKKDPNYNKRKEERKNFQVDNINMVKGMPASGLRRPPAVIVSPDGHKSDVYKFKFIRTEKFGNVPKYLAKRNEMINKVEMEYRREMENEEPKCKLVTDEEREEILDGLKKNWSQLHKEFLLLPMLIDTVPKIIRKTKLEARLKLIENDLRMVEDNPFIYVYGNSSN